MNHCFKYTCMLRETVEEFHGCLSAEDLLANLLHQSAREEDRERMIVRVSFMYQEAVQKTCMVSGQYPGKVLFFSFTPADGNRCAICAMTKVESGRCYLFTSDCDLAGFYVRQGCKVKMW